jgi:hypothetical protein
LEEEKVLPSHPSFEKPEIKYIVKKKQTIKFHIFIEIEIL